METAALVSSILSIILSIIIGGFAIWLSVTFYKMSNKISEDTKGAAKGISDSVNRLEGLFDKLYSDTFSMMKDTVTDMRKHIWPVKEKSDEEQKQIEEKANAKINELQEQLKKQISEELSSMMERVGKTDSKIDDVEKSLEKLVEGAIQKTRQVESEAQEEKSMTQLVDELHHHLAAVEKTTVKELLHMYRRYCPKKAIIAALEILTDKGPYIADGDLENPDTIITVF